MNVKKHKIHNLFNQMWTKRSTATSQSASCLSFALAHTTGRGKRSTKCHGVKAKKNKTWGCVHISWKVVSPVFFINGSYYSVIYCWWLKKNSDKANVPFNCSGSLWHVYFMAIDVILPRLLCFESHLFYVFIFCDYSVLIKADNKQEDS